MSDSISRIVDRDGYMTPEGIQEMDALARRSGWISFPAALPLMRPAAERGAEDLRFSTPGLLWLKRLARAADLLDPASAVGAGTANLFRQYGVNI